MTSIKFIDDKALELIAGGQDYKIHNRGASPTVTAPDSTLAVFGKVLAKIEDIPGIDVQPL